MTAATTGVDLDADGYSVDVWKDSGGSRIHVTSTGLPANGTVTISGLDPAAYQVELSGVAVNCDLASPNPQAVTLGSSDAAVQFDVTCALVTQLAFASTVDGNPEIYVINSNGTGSTRLTFSDPASDAEPAWSPDGTKIAFRSDRSGSPEIYVINADGSNPVRLTDAAGGNFHPAWSPDGTKIAFASKRNGNPEIFVMNADGSAVTQLTSSGGNSEGHSHPAWYPDGRKIAFVAASCLDTCSSVIRVMRANGTDLVDLTSGSDPAWRRGCVPTSPTEICDNGLDDDCNGLIDAADPACANSSCPHGDCMVDVCGQEYVCDGVTGCCVPHCGDGAWNGDEGDVDCGGSCGAKCTAGQHCWSNFDCASGSCVGDICQ